MRGQGVLATVADFLVEPVEPRPSEPVFAWTRTARPAIAVAGLAPSCGTTTVARALGAELALRDPDGAAVVSAAAIASGGIPLGTAAAGRLTRALSRSLPAQMRSTGRVCLTTCAVGEAATLAEAARDLAPLVLDVADPAQTAVAASVVDAVVLIGAPSAEPALAALLSDSLARVGPKPLVVLNRDRGEAERWDGRCDLRLPESRMSAQLALAGREPRGELGRAIARLADLVVGDR